MSSLKNHQQNVGSEVTRRFSDVPNTFRRRRYNDWRCLCPRRYILALMLVILHIIQVWRNISIAFTLAHVIVLDDEAAKIRYSSIGHWTLKELDNYKMISYTAEMFAQMPGALLIFVFSSYKFLLVSVLLCSLLHMLTPFALNHHSISLLFILTAQCVLAAPTYTAIMTFWKDWAPPSERTKLIAFSLYVFFLGAAAATFYPFVFDYITSDASYYLSGISGIIWVLFWYSSISDTPQNDPLISEEEIIFLENNIPSDHLHKIKVKDIPWKSIAFSKPVLVLCLIWFKVACSTASIVTSGALFSFHLAETYNPLYFFVPFVLTFGVLIPLSATLADCLIKKFSGKTLLIRKIFLSAGFFLQCIFMFGTVLNSEFIVTIFYMISYCLFAISIPGFITIALDLSPRYVSIIAGICFTFYNLGFMCVEYYIEATISLLHLKTLSWLFLFDGALSLLSIIFFALWGETEEQLWSLTFPSSRRTNDYKSYPKPEDEDDLNLVP